jgi:hypothetical protein
MIEKITTILCLFSIFFRRFHGFSHICLFPPPQAIGARRLGDRNLFLPAVAAEIARAGGICHRSGSRTLWRQAGSLANAGVADKRVRGLLIKGRRPLKTVALLERRKRPLCLWAHHAIERAIVEPHGEKLYLRPPDVIFREICGIYPVMRSFRQR